MEKWNIGFGVFYFPSGYSAPLSSSPEHNYLSLTTSSHDTLHIPLNINLSAYPHLETPFQILKSLIALQDHSQALINLFPI
jgi:hypothetical protein